MRKTWTEQMIATELRAVIATDGEMPTADRLRQLGRNDLAVQVSRKGGFIAWATRLGATREHSDSDTGWSGEIALGNILTKQGFEVERSSAVKAPYDLRINGCIRIDVKSAKYAEYGACRGWFYRVGKEAQADVLALFQLDTEVCYFLPWATCPVSNVTISLDGGKWSSFRDRYDILHKIVAARDAEKWLWLSLPAPQ